MLKLKLTKVHFLKIFSVNGYPYLWQKNLKVFLLLSLPFIAQLSCNTTDPKLEPDLKLELKDVSCTEVWLQLSSANIQIPNNISLLVNGSVKKTFNLNTQDSLLYIDSLLPNQTYKIIATMQQSNNASNELTVTTMDTTSHNFTWQTFEFGQHSSSTLYDVAIINENDIWAVGEIYMNDSLGNPDTKIYNAIHWNGASWELKRIQTLFRGNLITVVLEGVYTFSATDIWTVGSLPIHGDGINWIMYDVRTIVNPNLSLSKAWGSNSNDMYFVGSSGSITHYQNGTWTKIESNTTLPIRDIYGIKKRNNENFEILSVADSYGSNEGSKIISIVDNSAKTIWNDGRPYGLVSVWFIPDRKYFAVGDGLWESLLPTKNWIKNVPFPSLYKNYISGKSYNDIVVCGAYWLLAHYNGNSWQTYFPFNSGSFTSVKIKDNTIIGVGGSSSKAVVVIGKR
jgi:hypothetical protein